MTPGKKESASLPSNMQLFHEALSIWCTATIVNHIALFQSYQYPSFLKFCVVDRIEKINIWFVHYYKSSAFCNRPIIRYYSIFPALLTHEYPSFLSALVLKHALITYNSFPNVRVFSQHISTKNRLDEIILANTFEAVVFLLHDHMHDPSQLSSTLFLL